MAAGVLFLSGGCEQDEYYIDGGLADPVFDGSVLEYLESKPAEFDSLVQVIKLAGLEETFRQEEFTFFAPRDRNIKELIGRADGSGLNWNLYLLGKDTVQTLADVDSLIWRKYLHRHMFRGKNKLMDYPQIDFDIKTIYPGQNYYALSDDVFNIGVVYEDAGGVQYAGYRQLRISFIPDVSRPDENWYTVPVASSDIQPSNGVVHVLDVLISQFGFNQYDVINEIVSNTP